MLSSAFGRIAGVSNAKLPARRSLRKSALGGDLTILEECERGEDSALEAYREAIKEPLPADVAAVVQKQYEGVKRNHDQIRSMRDSMKAAT